MLLRWENHEYYGCQEYKRVSQEISISSYQFLLQLILEIWMSTFIEVLLNTDDLTHFYIKDVERKLHSIQLHSTSRTFLSKTIDECHASRSSGMLNMMPHLAKRFTYHDQPHAILTNRKATTIILLLASWSLDQTGKACQPGRPKTTIPQQARAAPVQETCRVVYVVVLLQQEQDHNLW
jgi:hypothetical protein